ncbi:MAG: O-antigen ligase family protein [Chthonomonas sp.]|nr:O-antigen ligase family protein [Chthonomonas sp.]
MEQAPLRAKIDRAAQTPEQLRRRMEEGRLVSLLRSTRVLLYWNFINIGFPLLFMMLPPSNVVASSLRYLMLSSILCAIITWWRLGIPIKLIWPIRFLLLLQVWLTVCSYLASSQLARTNDFETSNYFLIAAVMCFINAALIGHVWHEYRKWFLNALLVLFGVSCGIGVLQFIKVPPALILQNIYNARIIELTADPNAYGYGSVRATGLASWPEWLAFQGILGWGIIGSRLLRRSLVPWEFVLASFFLFSALIAQSRVMYVSLGVCTLTFLYMLIKRDPKFGKAYLTAFVVLMVGLVIVAGERLGYATQTNLATDTTLQYRQEIGWRQAYDIIEERPWTGIGPDDRLVWTLSRVIPDRYTQGTMIDNGFLLLLSWGGLPALALYLPIIVIGMLSSIQLLRNRKLSFERRQMAFLGALAVGLVLNNMMFNNGFTHFWMNCVIATIGALAMPNSSEVTQELKSRYHILRGRQTPDAISYAATTE